MPRKPNSFVPCFVTLVVLAAVPSAFAALPSLGQAADYVIYASSTELLINSAGTSVHGDVALGPVGTLNFNGGTINGRFFHDAGSTLNIAGGTSITGGQFLIDPTPIDADAHAAADAANALFTTQTFNSISSGQMIHGNGGLNVINVVNSIVLGNGAVLTLMGNGSDEFVFNVNGTMRLTGAASIQLIGVNPEQVLWNFVGEGQEVLIDASTASGTILAIDRNIRLEGGTVSGALISNGNQIKLQGGSIVNYAPIPEPATGLMVLAALTSLLVLRRLPI